MVPGVVNTGVSSQSVYTVYTRLLYKAVFRLTNVKVVIGFRNGLNSSGLCCAYMSSIFTLLKADFNRDNWKKNPRNQKPNHVHRQTRPGDECTVSALNVKAREFCEVIGGTLS